MGKTQTLLQALSNQGLLVPDPATDAELLDRYLDRRDEGAFAGLLARHGPMVWAVCRRALSDRHDAEDAFQATFLVFARKARTVSPRSRVGNWLYGVAVRAAHKGRTARARRSRERTGGPVPDPAAPDRSAQAELADWLDHELARLPDRHREPVVLCELEGLTLPEAAAVIGCPVGTVASRLARGREALAKRLARRGLAVAPGAVVALDAARSGAGVTRGVLLELATAAVAPDRASAAAVTLAKGVLVAMFVQKLRAAGFALAALLALGVAYAGIAGANGAPDAGAQQLPRPATEPAGAPAGPQPAPERKAPEPMKDDPGHRPVAADAAENHLGSHAGVWEVLQGTTCTNDRSRAFTPAEVLKFQLSFHPEGSARFTGMEIAGHREFVITIDALAAPSRMNFYPTGKDSEKRFRAVYELDAQAKSLRLSVNFAHDGAAPAKVGPVVYGDGMYLVLVKKGKDEIKRPVYEPANPDAKDKPAAKVDEKVRAELDKFQGLWADPMGEVAHVDGKEIVKQPGGNRYLFVRGDRVIRLGPNGVPTGDEERITLDVTTEPKRLYLEHVRMGGKDCISLPAAGIYRPVGDGIEVHFSLGGDAPKEPVREFSDGRKVGPPPARFLEASKPQKGLDGRTWWITRGKLPDGLSGNFGGKERPVVKHAAVAPRPVRPAAEWSGIVADPKLRATAPESRLVTDAASWRALWAAWRKGEPVPEVDFEAEVLLVFVAVGYNVPLVSLYEHDGRVTARVAQTVLGEAGFGYRIVKLARTGLKSVLDHNLG